MIFIGGISSGTKQIDYLKTVICSHCQSYGRYQVFMTYMYFSFFFIPLFKWNKNFYVKMSCCETVYQLNDEVGKRIIRGEQADITEQDLTMIQAGHAPSYRKKTCTACGFETEEDFDYCPKCGQRL